MEGSGTSVLYIGRTVLNREFSHKLTSRCLIVKNTTTFVYFIYIYIYIYICTVIGETKT